MNCFFWLPGRSGVPKTELWLLWAQNINEVQKTTNENPRQKNNPFNVPGKGLTTSSVSTCQLQLHVCSESPGLFLRQRFVKLAFSTVICWGPNGPMRHKKWYFGSAINNIIRKFAINNVKLDWVCFKNI